MLFATTIGEHFFFTTILVVMFLAWAIKTIASIDEGGEVKKAASERVAGLIERWLK
jgi:hypothetical protein